MSDRTKACIDISALHHNYSIAKKYAPNSNILAMVKSNAYGHGIISIGKILTQADGFGVACFDEAIKLREAGVMTPIVIMSGAFHADDLVLAERFDLQLVVHDISQIKLLRSSKVTTPLSVWLKIDTGMHRLGFAPEQFKEVYELLANCQKVKQPIVVMTHLADGDDLQKSTTQQQLDKFAYYLKHLAVLKSVANSAGILAWPEAIAEWNRPGIMLYGISPMIGKIGADHDLKPVMTLKSKIVAIHDFLKGDAIGYGGRWTCPDDMRVGIVAIGYGDGYPRHAKNGTPVLIKQKMCSLIGTVSMDLIAVDLRPLSEVALGEEVILWGKGLPAEIVAKYADTIAYELICQVSQRVVFNEEQGKLRCEL
ncbi:MAG: alanine racemase [Gammaproteobacteria bacterium]|nr:alanine racemase [Gammaproteobacteria bacterium]